MAVPARAFGPVDFAWQGRALEGSGGSRTRFSTRGFCVEKSSLLVSRATKPWPGRTLEGSGGSRALLCGRGVL